jgi:hypothetical protein
VTAYLFQSINIFGTAKHKADDAGDEQVWNCGSVRLYDVESGRQKAAVKEGFARNKIEGNISSEESMARKRKQYLQ